MEQYPTKISHCYKSYRYPAELFRQLLTCSQPTELNKLTYSFQPIFCVLNPWFDSDERCITSTGNILNVPVYIKAECVCVCTYTSITQQRLNLVTSQTNKLNSIITIYCLFHSKRLRSKMLILSRRLLLQGMDNTAHTPHPFYTYTCAQRMGAAPVALYK